MSNATDTYTDGPYIQAACFCDTVLRDDTGAFSLIRIIDTYNTTAQGPEPPAEMPPVLANLNLIIMLKSGVARGRSEIKIVPEYPNGETKDPLIFSVHFEGEEKGANIKATVNIKLDLEGLYWFYVYVEDQKKTAIPLRVKYHRVVTRN